MSGKRGGRENRTAHGADYVADCEQRGQWHLVAEFYAARLTDHQAAAEREPEWATYHQENAASAAERCLEATRRACGRNLFQDYRNDHPDHSSDRPGTV